MLWEALTEFVAVLKIIMVVVRSWAAGAYPPRVISLHKLLYVSDGRGKAHEYNAMAWLAMYVDKLQTDNANMSKEFGALSTTSSTSVTTHRPQESTHCMLNPNFDDIEFEIIDDAIPPSQEHEQATPQPSTLHTIQDQCIAPPPPTTLLSEVDLL